MTSGDVAGGTLPAHVVLVGLMGAGKTSVGRLVAERLDRPLRDSDAEVLARTGRTVRELWQDGGEAAYRPVERQVLLDALAGPGPDVVCAAAGCIDDPAARAALAGAATGSVAGGCVVVWLRAEVATLVERAATGTHRPLLDGDPADLLARQAAARAGRYAEVADLILDVDRSTPEALADAVVRALVRQAP